MTKYFTDSPYEKEMMEITKKDEFRKSLSYHNSCKFCMYYSQGKDKCKRTGVAQNNVPVAGLNNVK
ncbi:MAG: hypothetical protein HFJ99_04005 [Eubacterium sp.]|nr:hypothetical protein [Eubacterium sp.]